MRVWVKGGRGVCDVKLSLWMKKTTSCHKVTFFCSFGVSQPLAFLRLSACGSLSLSLREREGEREHPPPHTLTSSCSSPLTPSRCPSSLSASSFSLFFSFCLCLSFSCSTHLKSACSLTSVHTATPHTPPPPSSSHGVAVPVALVFTSPPVCCVGTRALLLLLPPPPLLLRANCASYLTAEVAHAARLTPLRYRALERQEQQ